MTDLLPFSRDFHANIKHAVPDPTDSSTSYRGSVGLSPRSVHDIEMWRLVLRTSWTDTRWLETPCWIPLLMRRLPFEDDAARAFRQEQSAQFVGFARSLTAAPPAVVTASTPLAYSGRPPPCLKSPHSSIARTGSIWER